MTPHLRQHWPWYAAGIGLLVFFTLLSPILSPFLIGAGLAYLGDPIVDRLQRWGLSRTLGVVVVFLGLTLISMIALGLIAPMLYQQSIVLLKNIPDWLIWLQDNGLPRLGIALPAGIRLDGQGLKDIVSQHWSSAGNLAGIVWAQVSQSGAAFATTIANLLLIPIVSFYLLRDWDNLVDWVARMIPPRLLPKVRQIAQETDQVMGSFLRGQLTVMLLLSLLYSTGLALAGLKLALVIGVMAGMLSFVPYLGFAVGFVAAALAMLVQEQSLLPLIGIVIVFGIGQIVEGWWLTPSLVGDKIGLHPVAVIFGLMAGGQLFGFVGLLLALPGSAAIAVLLRHAKKQWLHSTLYQEGAPSITDETARHPPADRSS
ncbi:AI-2E family transporter [Sinimarinibacterium sp. NLF-5-8]|uniref:AI-2E family transporter n=1 Tax=Sinimarinibacterium sp. NLF-5-8 TaxID=2698684 RepID=UPI00137BEDD3|nr:AI-2E family transporter [Sinimarinibacterium sp. NLF-5-8]QHS09164.1 AI-2E family transporter [Sinimarinibacterium sp. NLF-5-8]